MTKLEIIQHKILDLQGLKQKVNRWRLNSYKVAFTNGCFDILHKGHVKVIAEAAQTANKLVVAINTDQSVKALKGSDRPINAELDRAMVIASLQFVDAVILFDDATPLNLIKDILPDVLVKGGDYTVDTIVGAQEVLNNGGNVVVVPTEEGYATTNIINIIKK